MTHFFGFRDCCQESLVFGSAEAREAWETAPHTHDWELYDDE